MDAHILLGKLIIGIALTMLLSLIVLRQGWLGLPAQVFKRWAWAYFAVSRLGTFVVLFLVLRLNAQSDVAGFYYPQMKSALIGGLVYRDFPSSYAPLFPYTGAGSLLFWDSPKMLILDAIAFEAAGLAFWMAIATKWWDQPTARLATILYLLNPLPLINVAVDGQNQIWLTCFLGLAILLLHKRSLASGWALGLALTMVKFLALLFAPILGLCARQRGRWVLGLLLLPVAVYGFCIWEGADVLLPFRFEGGETTSGNLPFLLRPILPGNCSPRWFDAGVLVALAASFLGGAYHPGVLPAHRPRLPVYMTSLVLLTLLIVSKKTFTNYLVIGFFPLCITAAADLTSAQSGLRRLRLAALLGSFGTLAMLEPSLWYRWLGGKDLAVVIHSGLTEPVSLTRGRLTLFIFCEFALLAFYFWHWRTALRQSRWDRHTIARATWEETVPCSPPVPTEAGG